MPAGAPAGAAAAATQHYLHLGPQGGEQNLTALYGANSMWIEARQGHISRRAAARAYQAYQGR